MTVYLQKDHKTYTYDFWYHGKRYFDNTHQTTREAAQQVENRIREQLRHRAGGIATFKRSDSPTFRDWGKIFLDYKSKRLAPSSVKHLADILRVALRFWGAPDPSKP